MSVENFRKRILSNEHEQDDFFLPSDKVWDAVEEELDDKRKPRKPFILFFSSLIFLVIAFIGLLIPTTDDGASFSESIMERSVMKTNEIQDINQIHIAATDNNKQNNIDQNEIGNPKVISNSAKNNVKDLPEVPTLTSRAKEFNYATDKVIFDQNLHRKSYADFNSLDAKYINSTSKVNGFSQQSINEKTPHDLMSNVNQKNTVRGEINEKLNMLTMKDKIYVNRLPVLSSYIEKETNYNAINPTLVKIQKPSLHKDWIISANAYSSMSNYSISDYSGFEQIDFSLEGKTSLGYQLIIEKNITKGVSVYAGFGIDHAHFDANYLLTVDGDQLDFFTEDQTQSSATLSKTIPSLAGGLESTFLLNNFSSDLRSTTVDLSLAHDFKTVTVPIGARFSTVNSKKIKTSFALGLEFSKRLLTIDTGINSLTSTDADIELSSVAAVENEGQPFRIHNVNATTSISLDYQLSDKMSIGAQTGISKPLSPVYQDLNYSVNTFQIRGGINVKYAISSNLKINK